MHWVSCQLSVHFIELESLVLVLPFEGSHAFLKVGAAHGQTPELVTWECRTGEKENRPFLHNRKSFLLYL